jgi:hypothetical protein
VLPAMGRNRAGSKNSSATRNDKARFCGFQGKFMSQEISKNEGTGASAVVKSLRPRGCNTLKRSAASATRARPIAGSTYQFRELKGNEQLR